MSKRRYILQPIWFSFVLFGLLIIVAACGGSSSTTNTGTGTTPTAIAGNSSSPTSGTGNTPVSASPTLVGTSPTASAHATPSPTPTARPTPSPTSAPRPTPTPLPRPTPSPTPRPTPSPTPKPTPPPPPPKTVVITTNSKGVFEFSPSVISIPPGTLVTWVNHTTAPHTVTGGPLGSSIINPGGTFSFRFNSGGSVGYHCSIHPFMTGTVNVT
ncbi:MAG: hypothetical protein ABI406_15805 [Ktedonobacteraceae bacterium]